MLKHGILGLLNYSDMSGYEIMETFRDSLNYFWNAQTSQIYRELQTLKKSGYVTDTAVKGRGGDKKIFSITESGRQELINWLRSETGGGTIRSSLMMTTFFRGELLDEENIRYFEGIKQAVEVFAKTMDEPEENTEKYSWMTDPKRSVYWKMTVEYGRMYNEMLGQWAQRCIDMIKDEGNNK